MDPIDHEAALTASKMKVRATSWPLMGVKVELAIPRQARDRS
jgi:hypothetical protein